MSSTQFKIFIMNYDTFKNPVIPQTAYKQIKRCPSCQSVYIADSHCEACGRSMSYHPIGEPFGAKGLYGFKERYYGSLPLLIKYFSIFEDKTNKSARSYVRNLNKRFDDLLMAFGTPKVIAIEERRFFYVEILELIDELLRYGVSPKTLQNKLEISSVETGPLLTQELLLYLEETKKQNMLSAPWPQQILEHRFMGLRVEYLLKVVLITATVIFVAVNYYNFVSSQVGR